MFIIKSTGNPRLGRLCVLGHASRDTSVFRARGYSHNVGTSMKNYIIPDNWRIPNE